MYKIACTRKEASCIIGNLFQELVPVCKECRSFPEGVASISTVGGLTLKIATDLTIEGHGDLSGKPTKIRLTDYGFRVLRGHHRADSHPTSEVRVLWLNRQYYRRKPRYSWKGMSTPC